MTTKGVKRPRDAIQLGVLIVDIVSQVEDEGARLTLIRRSGQIPRFGAPAYETDLFEREFAQKNPGPSGAVEAVSDYCER